MYRHRHQCVQHVVDGRLFPTALFPPAISLEILPLARGVFVLLFRRKREMPLVKTHADDVLRGRLELNGCSSLTEQHFREFWTSVLGRYLKLTNESLII